MIFVALFVPLALYLLVLGAINRRPRPVIVPGTWDFVGLLFAASGFLLAGAPAALSSFNERWRLFWLLGEGGVWEGLRHAWHLGAYLSLLYFVVVLIGCVVLFRQHRPLTSIYNVQPSDLENALAQTCEQLGLTPVRSEHRFVFGPTPEDPGAVLELEPFDTLKHVTLRWQPSNTPLRPLLEAELDRRLAFLGAPAHDTGLWMTLLAYALLALSVGSVFMLVLRTLMGH